MPGDGWLYVSRPDTRCVFETRAVGLDGPHPLPRLGVDDAASAAGVGRQRVGGSVVVVGGGGTVGVTCSCVPRRGVTPGWSITSGTTVVVGAAVVVVVSTSSGTGGGVDASAAVANVIAAVAATITRAATRPNFARIGGMLVDTARHEAAASATVHSN